MLARVSGPVGVAQPLSASLRKRPHCTAALLAAIIAVTLTAPAAAAGQPAVLKPSPPIRPRVSAFPRLVAKRGQAAARINRLLKEADRSAVAGMCKDYRRKVRVTMRGPGYVSLLASDDWFCGGAYPDSSQKVLVYDLATGRPADWKTILTPALVDKVVPTTGGGESDPVRVGSSVLWALYLKQAQRTSKNKGCADVYADPGPLGTLLTVWPDAKADRLGLQPSEWPHVVKACAVPITIPAAELRKLGVQAAFLDALDEAHRRGWYDK